VITVRSTEAGNAEYNGTPAELHALFARTTTNTYGSTSTNVVGHSREVQVFITEDGTTGITATDARGDRVTLYRTIMRHDDLVWLVVTPAA
jgi:hypothetical protein